MNNNSNQIIVIIIIILLLLIVLHLIFTSHITIIVIHIEIIDGAGDELIDFCFECALINGKLPRFCDLWSNESNEING